jgi:hypothetical protein
VESLFFGLNAPVPDAIRALVESGTLVVLNLLDIRESIMKII